MKKKIAMTLLLISIPFALAACGGKKDETTLPSEDMVTLPEQTVVGETLQTETVNATTNMTDEEILRESLALLGKTDEESANVFGGGEQNYTADGEYLIGRNFNTSLFGQDTMVSTSYSEAGVVNSITAELKGNDAEFLKNEFIEIFGEVKDTTDTASESGSTYAMWEEEGKQIFLYRTGDMITLQLIMPDKQ